LVIIVRGQKNNIIYSIAGAMLVSNLITAFKRLTLVILSPVLYIAVAESMTIVLLIIDLIYKFC
jgi:hypothetical protein